MPRKAAFPPPIHHHRKSGQARVRYGGKDYYLGPFGSDLAARRYAQLVAAWANGEGVAPEPAPDEVLTVSDVVAAWLERAAPRYSARGRELQGFRRAFAALLAVHGSTPAAAFDAGALESVQQAMASGSWMSSEQQQAVKKRGKSTAWCSRVVNRMVGRIKTCWRWAERKKLVHAGAWANLRSLDPLRGNDPRVRHTSPRKPVDAQDFFRVARAALPAVRAMLILGWWTGMRPGEVRILRPCDVDRSEPDCWLYRPAQHKNDWRGQPRVVPVGRKAQAVLGPYLERCKGPESYVFAPARKRKGSRGHYSSDGYCQAVRRAARKAGVKDFCSYLCRHSAKQRITRAQGLDAARAVLGQKSLASTDGYAAGVDLDTARDAARKLG